MEIKKTSVMYFSPTDSTKNIMHVISGIVDGQACEVDITDYREEAEEILFEDNELLLVGVPVYSGRVPKTAAGRLQHIKGKKTPAVLVVTYGNRAYDDALLELKNIVSENGFIVIAAAAFVTEHSIMHSVASGRPDQRDIDQISEFAGKVKTKIESVRVMESKNDLFVNGNPEYREYVDIPLKPKAGNQCDKCGLCAGKCPVHAIPMPEPDKTLTDICISCMRCIKVCPKKAREVNKIMLFAATKKMAHSCKEAKRNELFI